MSKNVKEVDGRTRILEEPCNFTWSIENFSAICSIKSKEKSELSSSTFTTEKSSLSQWCGQLTFYDNDNKDQIGIYLTQTSSEASSCHVSFQASIIGLDKQKYCTRHSSGNLYENNFRSWGFSNFIQRNKLLEEKQLLLLPNNTLTVLFELKVSTVDDIINKTEVIHSSAPIVLKGTSLIADLQHLYENEIFSDFSVKVGEEEFKVHKSILSARSSVFHSMLNCNMTEHLTNSVEITDFDPPVVKAMLRYIYCGEVENLTPERSAQLFSIADKYNLQDLKNLCSKYLLQNLNVGNICTVLVLAEMHNEQELMKAAKRMFCANAAAIQETEPWIELSKTMPHLVMSMYQQLAISQRDLIPVIYIVD